MTLPSGSPGYTQMSFRARLSRGRHLRTLAPEEVATRRGIVHATDVQLELPQSSDVAQAMDFN